MKPANPASNMRACSARSASKSEDSRRRGAPRFEVRSRSTRGPRPELLDVFHRVSAHTAPISTSVHRRSSWCSGVPYTARFTAARRSYRWRSCSHVTAIPPWSCTHSLRMSHRWSPGHVRLRHADVASGVRTRRAARLRPPRSAHPLAASSAEQHVGEAVLQRLVRRERTAERPAVREVLERHRVHVVEGTHGLRAPAARARPGHWCSMSASASPIVADDCLSGNPHVVEVEVGEPAHEIDAATGHDREPGGVGVDEHLGRPVRRHRADEDHVGARGRFDEALVPRHEEIVAVVPHDGLAEPVDAPHVARFCEGPRRDRLAGHQTRHDLVDERGLPAAVQRVHHDVHWEQRSRRHPPTHLLRHHREVGDRVGREAAAAERLRREERGPAQLGRPAPCRAVEPVGIGLEQTGGRDGHLVVEEPARGRAEELHVVVQVEAHGTPHSRSRRTTGVTRGRTARGLPVRSSRPPARTSRGIPPHRTPPRAPGAGSRPSASGARE